MIAETAFAPPSVRARTAPGRARARSRPAGPRGSSRPRLPGRRSGVSANTACSRTLSLGSSRTSRLSASYPRRPRMLPIQKAACLRIRSGWDGSSRRSSTSSAALPSCTAMAITADSARLSRPASSSRGPPARRAGARLSAGLTSSTQVRRPAAGVDPAPAREDAHAADAAAGPRAAGSPPCPRPSTANRSPRVAHAERRRAPRCGSRRRGPGRSPSFQESKQHISWRPAAGTS